MEVKFHHGNLGLGVAALHSFGPLNGACKIRTMSLALPL
jgi:hypothetical protein